MKTGFGGNAKPTGTSHIPGQNDDSGEGAFHAPGLFRCLTRQGWGASRGIKGGSAPLASSYRGPDNVAGPLLGHLNPALAVVLMFRNSKLSHAGLRTSQGEIRGALLDVIVAVRSYSPIVLIWSMLIRELRKEHRVACGEFIKTLATRWAVPNSHATRKREVFRQ